MKTTGIAFFAYAVSDMKQSRAFYEGVLGLTPNSEYNGSGTLGIGCAPGMWDPSPKGASAALAKHIAKDLLPACEAQLPMVGKGNRPPCGLQNAFL